MGTFPMKGKPKVKATSWAIEMYISLHDAILWLLRKRGKRKVARKKRSILTSLDFESRIAMHLPFLMAKATLKAWSSILCVWILTFKSKLGFFFIRGPRKIYIYIERQVLEVVQVMISFYIEDLGKLMDKHITCILFFATLELNIIDKEKTNKMRFMWDNKLIRRWSILPKCKSSSSRMKITLLVTMWNAIVIASL